ncbi:MAG: hypothetical protein QME90_11150 [Thermodesulfobacteriota bacterium]|nr:hypothetical protein [Thermodesulfobacteriota bacterium]
MKLRRLYFLSSLVVVLTVVSLWLGITLSSAAATTQKPYYAGKVITIWVPSGVGGGDDLFARFIGMHLGKHVPGNPSVVIRNQPAAGGLIAANSVWASKPDGLTALEIGGKEPLNSILRPKGTNFKLEEGYPIIAVPSGTLLYAKAGMVKEPKDIMTAKGLIFGSSSYTAAGGASFVWFKELLEFPVEKVIWGYGGVAASNLALLSGEINLTGASSLFYNQTIRAYAEKGEVVPIVQSGLIDSKGEVVKEAAAPNVPTTKELYRQIYGKAPSGVAWEIVVLMTGMRTIGKAIVLPPQTPKELANLLTKAAIDMAKDPKYLELAEKLNEGAPSLVGEDVIAAFRLGTSSHPKTTEFMKKVLTEKYKAVFD